MSFELEASAPSGCRGEDHPAPSPRGRAMDHPRTIEGVSIVKIVVVGATGNVGSHTLDEALAQGHEVVAFVRRPEAITARDGLTIAKGDAGDTAALAAAASGADAVIVAINGALKDATFLQRTLPNIGEAIKQAKAGRLVLVSAFGSGVSAAK